MACRAQVDLQLAKPFGCQARSAAASGKRRHNTSAPQRLSPAAAQQRPKWQPPGSDGVLRKQKTPRHTGAPTTRPPRPQKADFAQIFRACRAAARELLKEGGLTSALREWKGHPLLSSQGEFAYAALVSELRESYWKEEIPCEGFQAILCAIQEQGFQVRREVTLAGFLSYYTRGDSAAAFELLQRLPSGRTTKLQSRDIIELCSACSESADPAAIRKLIGYAASQGLSMERHWFTSLIAAHAEAGDVEGAKTALKDTIAAGLPCDLPIYFALAWAFVRCGCFEEAKTCLDPSILHQKLPKETLRTALNYFGTIGCLDRVDILLREAVKHGMQAENLFWWAAVAYAEAGRPADVERVNREAAAVDIQLLRATDLFMEASAHAGDLPGMRAVMQRIPAEDRWQSTVCCYLMAEALGKAGALEELHAFVELMRRSNSKGLLRMLAIHSYWLSAWGNADEAEAALLEAPLHTEDQWKDWPRHTADLCSSTFMACWSLRAASNLDPNEEEQQERFRLAEVFSARGAALQPRHSYFDLDLSTDLAWPAQLRLLAWLQGLLSAARSGKLVLEYQTEVRFLTKQFRLRKEGMLAPEDMRAALLGLLHNLGMVAAVSPTDQRLVTVQVADLKLAIGERLRRRGGFEAWPNRGHLVKPTRA